MDNSHNNFDGKEKTVSESIKIGKFRISGKAIFIAFLVIVGLAVFFAISSIVNSRSVKELKKENRDIAAQNKVLEKQMDSLNQKYSLDSLALQLSIQETENLKADRQELLDELRSFSIQLNKFKPQYEKVSNYKNIPADSGLFNRFDRRFDY